MNIRNQILEPDCFYHIYNRGVNSAKIFNEDQNYIFFLKKLLQYSLPVLDVYAYCMLPTHFHIVIKVKSQYELKQLLHSESKSNTKFGLHSNEMIVSKQIAKFLSSYSQAFNKSINRHGAILESPFKRKKILDENYLKNVIIYTHLNPQDIGTNFQTYKYSSYCSILSARVTNLKRNEVLAYFGGRESFIYSHRLAPKADFNF